MPRLGGQLSWDLNSYFAFLFRKKKTFLFLKRSNNFKTELLSNDTFGSSRLCTCNCNSIIKYNHIHKTGYIIVYKNRVCPLRYLTKDSTVLNKRGVLVLLVLETPSFS